MFLRQWPVTESSQSSFSVLLRNGFAEADIEFEVATQLQSMVNTDLRRLIFHLAVTVAKISMIEKASATHDGNKTDRVEAFLFLFKDEMYDVSLHRGNRFDPPAEAEQFTNVIHSGIMRDSILYSLLEQIMKLFFQGQAFSVLNGVISKTSGAMILLQAQAFMRIYEASLLIWDFSNVERRLYFSVWPCWRKKKLQKTDLVGETRLRYQIYEASWSRKSEREVQAPTIQRWDASWILLQTHYLQAHQDMRSKKHGKFMRRVHLLLQYKCICFPSVGSLLAHHESFHEDSVILIAATNCFMSSISFQLGGKLDL